MGTFCSPAFRNVHFGSGVSVSVSVGDRVGMGETVNVSVERKVGMTMAGIVGVGSGLNVHVGKSTGIGEGGDVGASPPHPIVKRMAEMMKRYFLFKFYNG